MDAALAIRDGDDTVDADVTRLGLLLISATLSQSADWAGWALGPTAFFEIFPRSILVGEHLEELECRYGAFGHLVLSKTACATLANHAFALHSA